MTVRRSPTSATSPLQPPLVTELFDPKFFGPVLRHYPLAQAASTEARSVIGRGESIENYPEPEGGVVGVRQARYWQMPLYLQHLLWLVGKVDGTGFTRDPGNLQTLVDAFLAGVLTRLAEPGRAANAINTPKTPLLGRTRR